MASAHGDLRHLLPGNYKRHITAWLEEDCPSLDYGGFVVGESEGEARLLGKSKVNQTYTPTHGILAGVPFFDEVFTQLGCTYANTPLPTAPAEAEAVHGQANADRIEWHIQEGEAITPIQHCATVRGPIRKILLGERVALNILARCSGIASKSASMLSALRAQGWQGILAGTRKTTPGFRLVEKYGMLAGGADPHRHDLSSMTMLKDNHVWACANNRAAGDGGEAGTKIESVAGAIPRAVHAAKATGGFSTKVEVECRSVEEANAAIGAGADVIMLDNFTADGVRAAAKELKTEWASKKAFLIEVSGGLTEENAPSYVCEDVDILSTSSIHQGTGIVDFSLKVSLR
ncbi:Aldolase-type TIM barrel [Penicillium brevicompactum]|uniref:nicotinate-nucleotide diphosphorylase (carboxylating) n=1 Tax=Penicillium brevicompactum TaxID=5074 RepID=A0A9W9QIU3_PENBR|nr:Aldolase-type TIM barrel [Penicillium brevicompactum]